MGNKDLAAFSCPGFRKPAQAVMDCLFYMAERKSITLQQGRLVFHILLHIAKVAGYYIVECDCLELFLMYRRVKP